MRELRIGLAQCRQTADFGENAATIRRFLEEAGKKEVQILCFPEAQTVGYRADITEAQTPMPVAALAQLHGEVAQRCGELGMACILGTETESAEGKPYNSALVIEEQGKILGAHHKARLTPLDAMAYAHGETFETFELHGVQVGVVICYEGFRYAETTAACVGEGAQLIFHPQNNTTRPMDWKIPIHHAMIVTRAAENTVWFASCNACLVPHQNCRTMVVAPDGRIEAQAEMKCEELLVADIDVERATRAMYRYDMEDSAEMLFGAEIQRSEYAQILPEK
jgi:predicted amidohydrolase